MLFAHWNKILINTWSIDWIHTFLNVYFYYLSVTSIIWTIYASIQIFIV